MIISDMFKNIAELGLFISMYISQNTLKITHSDIIIDAKYDEDNKQIIVKINEGNSLLFHTEVSSSNGMSDDYIHKFRSVLCDKIGSSITTIDVIYKLLNDFIYTSRNKLIGFKSELDDLLRLVPLDRVVNGLISTDDVRFKYDRDISYEAAIKYCDLLKSYLEEKLGIKISYIKLDQSMDYSFRIISSLTKDLFRDKLESNKTSLIQKISK